MKQTSHSLKQAIGAFGLAAMVFNCTVGGGIFRLPGEIYEIAGKYSPLAYLLCACATVLIAMVFIAVGKDESQSGGPYAYVERELGPLTGFIAGFLLLLLGIFAMASVSNALVESIFALLPNMGSFANKAMIIVSIFAFIGACNCRGVKAGANLVSLMTFLKLTPLLILIAVGLTQMNVESSGSVAQISPISSVFRAALLLMFAFMGIESALTPSAEIKHPEKNLKKGLFMGMAAVLMIYLGLQVVTQNILGAQMVMFKSAPLAFAAEKIMGSFGKTLLLVGAVLSMFGYLSSMSLAMPRLIYKMGKDKILPEMFGQVNRKYQTPNVAIVTLLLIVVCFALTGTFTKLALIANLSAISMYILCAIAALKMNPKKPLVPILTIVVLSALLSGLQFSEYMGVLLASSLAAIIFMLRKGKPAKEKVSSRI